MADVADCGVELGLDVVSLLQLGLLGFLFLVFVVQYESLGALQVHKPLPYPPKLQLALCEVVR
jgi:hypothetical protein